MPEDLYEEIVEVRRRGQRAALATIVARKGSTPRKDPAKMLVYEDGRQWGSIGFKIAVVDDRIKYANPERFPQADTIYVDPWEENFRKLPVNDSSYVLIATRGHNFDLACLRFALHTPAKYIGLLGSRRKTKLLYEALEREGIDPGNFERVYAPVGIEIGSETPEEIAISIAAELVAVKKNLQVRPLKESLRYLKPVATIR